MEIQLYNVKVPLILSSGVLLLLSVLDNVKVTLLLSWIMLLLLFVQKFIEWKPGTPNLSGINMSSTVLSFIGMNQVSEATGSPFWSSSHQCLHHWSS